jgi:CubicO group peptidase (beta-lactamase class C family)
MLASSSSAWSVSGLIGAANLGPGGASRNVREANGRRRRLCTATEPRPHRPSTVFAVTATGSARLAELLASTRDSRALPGLAYAVVADGEVVCAGGIGDADVASGRAVDADVAFPIASITKVFTALLAMQLVEAGELELDRPVNERLTSFEISTPRGTAEVTARHLLTHTAGIGQIARWSDLWSRRSRGGARLGTRFAPRLRTDRTVGRKWAYSNAGYIALAALIEDVTRQRFADLLGRRLLAPLDMPRTALAPDGRIEGSNVTRYAADAGGRLTPVEGVLDEPGAGGICAPASELVNLLLALTVGDPQVTRATLAEMMRPGPAYDGIGGMGLGFQCIELDGIELRGHSGNTDGASSGLLIAPDRRIGAVVMTNVYTLAMPGLAARLVLEACGRSQTLARRAPPAPRRDLRGPYRPARGLRTNLQLWAYLGGEVDIVDRDGGLALRGATPLGPFARPIPLEPLDAPSAELVRYRLEVEGVPVVAAFVLGARGVSHLNFGGLLGYFELRRRPRATALRIVAVGCVTVAIAAAAAALIGG